MTLESLETFDDEQLQAVIARAGELLKQHDRERKEKALADARSILAGAGLNLKDVTAKGRRSKPAKAPVYQSGHRYQHPSKPELIWNAKGQKPGWLRDIEREGVRPLHLSLTRGDGIL